MRNSAKEKEFLFSNSDFKFLSKLAGKKTGIMLSESKRDMVYARIARRVRALGLKTFREYCDLLASPEGGDEIVDMVNAITTNLTKFFREEHHFDHLAEYVLAPLLEKPPVGKRVRIWSAGCSSGMEPYSIAMTACNTLPNITSWNFKILATDIDTNMLNNGREGVYRKSDVDVVPSAYQSKYILHYGGAGSDEVIMSDMLKKMITFKHLNFLEKWPIKGPFDAIFCRNVVIYFNKETQRVLFDQFADVLRPDGWLYIGHSENLSTVTDRFALEGRTIYRRVK